MNLSEAGQIAALLNERNQLAGMYTDKSILSCAETYDYEIVDGEVASCVQRKELQWYQWEILHLSTSEKHEGKGLAYKVYKRTEDRAIANGVQLLQCTIREGNRNSEEFFTRQGFTKVNRFRNNRTSHVVGVWQKVLETDSLALQAFTLFCLPARSLQKAL